MIRFMAACVAAFLVTLALLILFSGKPQAKPAVVAWCVVEDGMRVRFGSVVYDYDNMRAFLPCKMLPLKRRA